jgi:L-lactate dehydrogenase complex protein LldG
MELPDSKNIILHKVKEHLNKNDVVADLNLENPANYYIAYDLPSDQLFKQELSKVSGNCVICNSRDELISGLKSLYAELQLTSVFCLDNELQKILAESNLPFSFNQEQFEDIEAGFTFCEFLIARLGSIMISSKQTSGRKLNIFPPVHIVLGYSSQLVSDIDEAFFQIRKKYNDGLPSLVSIITGPSRTADIEKTLILGAHGPKQLFVFLLKDN